MSASDERVLPRSVRLWLFLASRLVPPSARTQWEAEWKQELERWAEAGATGPELRRRAMGSVRDVLWQRRRTGYNPVSEFFSRPFRAELALISLAGTAWLVTSSFWEPEPPYPNEDRVVTLERGISAMGARHPMMSRRLVEGAAALASLEQVALFRLGYRIQEAAFVSANFFEVLGVSPAKGRLLREEDGPMSVVISYRSWLEQFSAEAEIVGSSIRLAHQDYEIVGVLPTTFRLERRDLRYFLPLPDYVQTVGGVALMQRRASVAAAEEEFRQLASTLEPGWSSEAFGLRGSRRTGSREAWLALFLGLIAFLTSGIYLAIKRVRGWKYYLALAVRLLLTLTALSGLQVIVGRLVLNGYWMPSFLPGWMFLAACTVAVILVVRDHRNRCPVCLERLRMPVSLGNWSSVMMDPPGTEYACPKGHGLLYTPESGGTEDQWTTLDSSWSDLFERHR